MRTSIVVMVPRWVRFSRYYTNKIRLIIDNININKYITMIIKNKITGRDISTEYLALMSGLITNDEFELITLTIK